MYDAASLSEVGRHQRAAGELRVELRLRDGLTVLDGLRQVGCLKAKFPRRGPGEWMEVVTLNTSGGIAGGDALTSSFHLQPGTQAVIASQAAERFYRALGEPASVRTRLVVGAGASAEWLPQETILYDGCALDRRLEVELDEDASFLGVETLVFGRAMMGEVVRTAWLRDAIRIRRGGRLVLNDAVRFDGEVAALLQRKAIADGARALATVWSCSPRPLAREVGAPSAPGEGATSTWDNMRVTRLLAPDSASLRRQVIDVLASLRDNRPLPRVWLC